MRRATSARTCCLTSVRQKYDPNKVMFSGLDFMIWSAWT